MSDAGFASGSKGGMRAATLSAMQRALLDWYAEHGRSLPWRAASSEAVDPYAVVVSEVMLQQTQVERVIPIYQAFLRRYPGFRELAAAPVGEVIRAWAGLGYNRRAVYLHRLAHRVVAEHGGRLPDDPKLLRQLPGVGPYTVGAILAFAFGRDVPALDTNVRRVLTRVFFPSGASPTPHEIEEAARASLPEGRASDWNQALMDLGSTICAVRAPRCLVCPLRRICQSAGAADSKPTRKQGTFRGSNRYYRGRLVAALREERPGYRTDLGTLERRLAGQGIDQPPGGWRRVAEGLARDGLLELGNAKDSTMVALPDEHSPNPK